MAKDLYVERPAQVQAEQFLATKPFPANVDDCGRIDGPHVHLFGTTAPLLMPVHETDWVIAAADGTVFVLDDGTFTATYVKKTGP